METEITLREAYKINLINLVRHHKEHCSGDCNISLLTIKMMMLDAGYRFTKEETALFI